MSSKRFLNPPAVQFEVPPPSEKIAGGFQQVGKKEGGLGEGIFARLLSAPKARQGVAKRFRRLALSQTSKQNNFQFLLRKIWRAGVKKLKENCFALLAEVRWAETRSGANQEFFVQKRFELRSVIATIQEITMFEEVAERWH